jgi:hypothetical protein
LVDCRAVIRPIELTGVSIELTGVPIELAGVSIELTGISIDIRAVDLTCAVDCLVVPSVAVYKRVAA